MRKIKRAFTFSAAALIIALTPAPLLFLSASGTIAARDKRKS